MSNANTPKKTNNHRSLSTLKNVTAVMLLATPLFLNGCTTISGLFGDEKKVERGVPKESEQAYFQKAQKDIERERYIEAEKALEDLRTFYPVGFYSKQALLDLIYVKIQKGDFQQASLNANRFLENYPTHSQADYAWYAKGIADMHGGFSGIMKYTNLNQAHRDTSFLRAAYIDFKNLVQRYPNSRYTPDAIQRMYFIYNQFAEHEMNIARFNIKRKAYLGAIERAKMVFMGFPQSPQTPEAIATLAYSYGKLGMTQQENTYKKLLLKNYPHLLAGNNVRLSAARTDASWVNKLTLGLFGRPATTSRTISKTDVNSITPPTNSKESRRQLPRLLQNNTVIETGKLVDKPTQPSEIENTVSPSTNLSIGLGLPDREDNTMPSDNNR